MLLQATYLEKAKAYCSPGCGWGGGEPNVHRKRPEQCVQADVAAVPDRATQKLQELRARGCLPKPQCQDRKPAPVVPVITVASAPPRAKKKSRHGKTHRDDRWYAADDCVMEPFPYVTRKRATTGRKVIVPLLLNESR